MQREPLAPQKVSQTLLLPFVISLIASQCAPDPSLFFFFSPESNTFIMGYLCVCKCRTAACLQKLKQASSNKIEWFNGRAETCFLEAPWAASRSSSERWEAAQTDACKWCGRRWCWFVLRTLCGSRETWAGMETRPWGAGTAPAEGSQELQAVIREQNWMQGSKESTRASETGLAGGSLTKINSLG